MCGDRTLLPMNDLSGSEFRCCIPVRAELLQRTRPSSIVNYAWLRQEVLRIERIGDELHGMCEKLQRSVAMLQDLCATHCKHFAQCTASRGRQPAQGHRPRDIKRTSRCNERWIMFGATVDVIIHVRCEREQPLAKICAIARHNIEAIRGSIDISRRSRAGHAHCICAKCCRRTAAIEYGRRQAMIADVRRPHTVADERFICK